MPLQIIRQDIIKMQVDAIVNSAHPHAAIGYGVDSRIHDAAGPMLFKAREQIGSIPVSKAFMTEGYKLMAKNVIHTVGPNYYRNQDTAPQLLYDTYTNCLKVALLNNLKSIAFPLLSSGVYGYPKDEALSIAKVAISTFLLENDLDVYLVLYDQDSYDTAIKYGDQVNNYIIKNYDPSIKHQKFIEEIFKNRPNKRPRETRYESAKLSNIIYEEDKIDDDIRENNRKRNINRYIDDIDETFSDLLFRFIREKTINEVKMYQEALISKQHFSKMKSDSYYQPKRETVFLLCIAMNLNLEESNQLLQSAGYAFNNSSKFELIIKYFIEKNIYNFHTIDSLLMQYDQKTLRKYG